MWTSRIRSLSKAALPQLRKYSPLFAALHGPSLGQVLLGEICTAKESFAKASAQAESYISIDKDDEAIT